ncbi:MAG: helix-turn-helix domain-containing protein [Vicinamibacterales bacterium]
MEGRANFCNRLKAAREKKGVSLEQIAASTKIRAAFLKDLERNDLSRWPTGLFRRSYLRDYLRAVDLPVDATVSEFLRLFPEGNAPVADPVIDGDESERPALAMTLGDDRADRRARAGNRLLAATFDAGIVLVLSGAAASLLQASVWASVALAALGYYSIATAWLGCSFGTRWVVDRSWRRWQKAGVPQARPDPLLERIGRLGRLSVRRHGSTARDMARVPWNAVLLRIRFLR